MYQRVINELRVAYDRGAQERDREGKTAWKIAERQYFLELLQREGKQSLLEIGAGTGQDSRFFADQGLRVVCTDLSSEMVKCCRAKGLEAYVMDFLHLDFPPETFEAVFSLNCLLHVPSQELPGVLLKIRELLKPAGLFFLGVYGGIEQEGVWPNDQHEPKRFFSYHTDAYMQQAVSQYFELVAFKAIALEEARGGDKNQHFQSMILRKR